MTSPTENTPVTEKVDNKELNFRKQEAMYQRMLAEKDKRLQELEQMAQQRQQPRREEDDEEDDDPYVDKKKLNKTLAKFEEKNKQETQSDIQRAVKTALDEEKKKNWLERNPDFFDVLEQYSEKLYEHDPDLANDILELPKGFERQKVVYRNIKALGLHKEKTKEPSIQEKIDANRRSPYYQPTGVGTNPYSSQGDFSQSGQKNAYDKMQELKSRLRI